MTTLKKILVVLILILAHQFISTSVIAQTPNKFKYQAVLRNADGTIMANEDVTVDINILQGSATGTSVFSETHNVTTTAQGLINLNIGSINDLSVIDWSADTYFVEVSINGTVMGTSQLLSVPYALHSKTADSLTGTFNETDPVFSAWDKDYADLTNKPAIVDTVSAVLDTTTQFLRTEVDGSVTNEIQDLQLNGNILTITNNGSATNIDLSPYLDNTDDQTLAEVLTISNDAGSTQIKNIADPTDNQDAVTKAYVSALEAKVENLQNALIVSGLLVKDYDGNLYGTVKIGDQIWMTENLKVTHYPNGDPIPFITNNTNWGNLSDNNTDDAYCFYNNDVNSDYGALYTYAAAIGDNWERDNVDNQGVCPDGWHLPTDAEWQELIDTLGGNSVAAGKLKETGTSHWTDPNIGASNESGFTALPGGWRDEYQGTSNNAGDLGIWWSAMGAGFNTVAYYRRLDYYSTTVVRNYGVKSYGFSVRCLKDN